MCALCGFTRGKSFNFEAVIKAQNERQERIAVDMPTVVDALKTVQDAYERMRSLGWREGKYCPKDTSEFAFVELGSCGIFSAYHDGTYLHTGDFVMAAESGFWKPTADLTPDENELRKLCDAKEVASRERELSSFAASEIFNDMFNDN